MNTHLKHDPGKESLKELKELLANDVMSSDDDDDRLIPKKNWTASIIRLSVFTVMWIILFFIGVFDSVLILLSAIGVFVLLEALTLLKSMREIKRARKGPQLVIPGRKK
ncbi:MAG: hypothetical protein GY757_34270 [bacterium]|nr:hypothetical protein [bacterium]